MNRLLTTEHGIQSRQDHTADVYPFAAGHRGVETSIEAARKMDVGLSQAEAEVMVELRCGNATSSEIFERIALKQGFTPEQIDQFYELRKISRRISPRSGQLLKKGKVFEVGRRKSACGNTEIVWSVKHQRKETS